jgi:hypothetical protein
MRFLGGEHRPTHGRRTGELAASTGSENARPPVFLAAPRPARQTVTLRPTLRMSGGVSWAANDVTKAFHGNGMTYLSMTQPHSVIVITGFSTRREE